MKSNFFCLCKKHLTQRRTNEGGRKSDNHRRAHVHIISKSKRKSEKALYTNCCCFSKEGGNFFSFRNKYLNNWAIEILVLPCDSSHRLWFTHQTSCCLSEQILLNKSPKKYSSSFFNFPQKYSFVVVTDGERIFSYYKYLLRFELPCFSGSTKGFSIKIDQTEKKVRRRKKNRLNIKVKNSGHLWGEILSRFMLQERRIMSNLRGRNLLIDFFVFCYLLLLQLAVAPDISISC